MIAECFIAAGLLGAGGAIYREFALAGILEAGVDRDIPNRDAREAQHARQRAEARALTAEAALAAVRRELEFTEEFLALAHQDVDRAQAGMALLAVENMRLRADPPWMQRPLVDFCRPLPANAIPFPGPVFPQ